ncbi:hypothetical protein QE152_g24924, partial [Popillia japonica]
GLTLDKLLAALEAENNVLPQNSEINIVMMLATNACADLTDEDSADEEQVTANNLPGSQLRSEAEILGDGDWEDEDDILLSRLTVIQKYYK